MIEIPHRRWNDLKSFPKINKTFMSINTKKHKKRLSYELV